MIGVPTMQPSWLILFAGIRLPSVLAQSIIITTTTTIFETFQETITLNGSNTCEALPFCWNANINVGNQTGGPIVTATTDVETNVPATNTLITSSTATATPPSVGFQLLGGGDADGLYGQFGLNQAFVLAPRQADGSEPPRLQITSGELQSVEDPSILVFLRPDTSFDVNGFKMKKRQQGQAPPNVCQLRHDDSKNIEASDVTATFMIEQETPTPSLENARRDTVTIARGRLRVSAFSGIYEAFTPKSTTSVGTRTAVPIYMVRSGATSTPSELQAVSIGTADSSIASQTSSTSPLSGSSIVTTTQGTGRSLVSGASASTQGFTSVSMTLSGSVSTDVVSISPSIASSVAQSASIHSISPTLSGSLASSVSPASSGFAARSSEPSRRSDTSMSTSTSVSVQTGPNSSSSWSSTLPSASASQNSASSSSSSSQSLASSSLSESSSYLGSSSTFTSSSSSTSTFTSSSSTPTSSYISTSSSTSSFESSSSSTSSTSTSTSVYPSTSPLSPVQVVSSGELYNAQRMSYVDGEFGLSSSSTDWTTFYPYFNSTAQAYYFNLTIAGNQLMLMVTNMFTDPSTNNATSYYTSQVETDSGRGTVLFDYDPNYDYSSGRQRLVVSSANNPYDKITHRLCGGYWSLSPDVNPPSTYDDCDYIDLVVMNVTTERSISPSNSAPTTSGSSALSSSAGMTPLPTPHYIAASGGSLDGLIMNDEGFNQMSFGSSNFIAWTPIWNNTAQAYQFVATVNGAQVSIVTYNVDQDPTQYSAYVSYAADKAYGYYLWLTYDNQTGYFSPTSYENPYNRDIFRLCGGVDIYFGRSNIPMSGSDCVDVGRLVVKSI